MLAGAPLSISFSKLSRSLWSFTSMICYSCTIAKAGCQSALHIRQHNHHRSAPDHVLSCCLAVAQKGFCQSQAMHTCSSVSADRVACGSAGFCGAEMVSPLEETAQAAGGEAHCAPGLAPRHQRSECVRCQQQELHSHRLVSIATGDSGNWVISGGVNLRYQDRPLLRGN